MRPVVRAVDVALRWSLVILATLMVATVTWQVLSRYVFRAPSSLTEEIARFQLIWLGLLGSVYTFRNRMHVGIDILIGNWTGKRRVAAELASLICCMIFAATLLVFGGWKLVALVHDLDQTSAALGVRMSWVYAIIPFSGVLWLLYGAYYIGDLLRHGRLRLPSEINGDKTQPGRGDARETIDHMRADMHVPPMKKPASNSASGGASDPASGGASITKPEAD